MELDKNKKDFRVWWQHLETLNADVYPKQEPFFTYEQAERHVTQEKRTGYLRANIIGRNGLSC